MGGSKKARTASRARRAKLQDTNSTGERERQAALERMCSSRENDPALYADLVRVSSDLDGCAPEQGYRDAHSHLERLSQGSIQLMCQVLTETCCRADH